MANQNLVFVGDQILLNYTNGETCHKIYQRSTLISFSCHPDAGPVSMNPQVRLTLLQTFFSLNSPSSSFVQGEPEFIKETPDCSYLFTWPTALACAKTISCSYKYEALPVCVPAGQRSAV